MNSQLIQTVLDDGIRAAIVAVAGYVVAFMHKHFTANQIVQGVAIAKEAVAFAEQVGKTMGLNGAAKYDKALTYAEGLATKVGVKLNSKQWQGLIESAVLDLKKELGTLTTPTKPVA